MKIRENEVWVEYLYDGTWLMKKFYNKLFGYRIKKDPCNSQEYEPNEVPTFKERAEMLKLDPVIVECVGILFE